MSKKTVKELDAEVQQLKKIIESLKEELDSTCRNFNLKIEKLEQKLADVDQSRPLNHSTKKRDSKCKNCLRKCNICSKGFEKNVDLEKHIEKEHDKYEEFACDKCEHKFVLKWRFEKHKEVHAKKLNSVITLITRKNAHLLILGANSSMK